VSWVASHALFVTTNYYPKVDESDHGTWRRLAMLEFRYRYRKSGEPIERVNEKVGDPGLRQRLRHPDAPRAQAVLAWLVAGAMKWYAHAKVMPELPQAVTDSTGRWRRQVDQLARYIDDNLIFDPSTHVHRRVRRRALGHSHMVHREHPAALLRQPALSLQYRSRCLVHRARCSSMVAEDMPPSLPR
jgi:hypothetical protein